MGLYNNSIGISLAKSSRAVGISAMADAVQKEVRAGKMLIIVNGKLVASNSNYEKKSFKIWKYKMKQNRTQIIVGLCGLLIAVILSVWATCWYSQKGSITISNTSNQTISDIYVVYNTNGTEYKSWIGAIPANASYNYRINYHNIAEGSIYIFYQDKKFDTLGYVAYYDKKHYRVNIQ